MTEKKKRLVNAAVQAEFLGRRDATNGRLRSEGGSLYYRTKTPPVVWLELARWSADGECVWLWGAHTSQGIKDIVGRLSYTQAVPSFTTLDLDNPIESARALLKENADFKLRRGWLYRYELGENHFSPYATNEFDKFSRLAEELHGLFGGPRVSVVMNAKVLRRLAKRGVDVPLTMWAKTVEDSHE